MTDQNPEQRRPPPRRPPRPPQAPGGPAAGEAEAGRAARRVIPPSSYREHLETEHGLKVVAEAGWPTDIKRFFLVRSQDGSEKSIAAFRGTFPEAVTHFYYLLHPEQRSRR